MFHGKQVDFIFNVLYINILINWSFYCEFGICSFG